MNQTTPNSTNIHLLRYVGTVLAVTIVCFLVGGGWHLICNPDDLFYGYFHGCHSDEEKIKAAMLLFVCGGAAAGTLGAIGATCAIILRRVTGAKKRS